MPTSRNEDDEKCWKRRTKLEKILIVSCSILGILFLVYLLWNVLRKSCEADENECTTRHCVEAAAEILEFIDTDVDPCQNFYKYACGAYYKNAVKKDSPSPWSTTQTLFENELKSLVVDPIRRHDSNAHVAMKQYYHECMNLTKIDEDDNKTFMENIVKLGGWPLNIETAWNAAGFNWADWYLKARMMGLPVVGFFYFKATNIENRNETILGVDAQDLSFFVHYSKHEFTELLKGLSGAFNISYHEADIVDLYNFIIELRGFKVEANDEIEDLEITTIQNLTEICPNVPWLKLLNGISGKAAEFKTSSEVGIYSDILKNFCRELQELLKKAHPKVIANYYIWSIIQNAHHFMNSEVRRVYEDINSESEDRFSKCYDATDSRFQHLKETIYVRKKTSPKVKEGLREMIEIMKELFVEHLKKCDWMDETTRKEAIDKAKAIQSLIGADDELYDTEKFDTVLGLDQFKFTSDNMFKMYQEKIIKEDQHFYGSMYQVKNEDLDGFFKNAFEVNAFFAPNVNAMIIPAPILTSIFYNRKFPAFMNYGAMGSTVGHEFMHGFSKISRVLHLENGTTLDWWTNSTADTYDKKVKCVIDEYESIPFRYQLNGTRTLDENLADYVGADLGYEAYQRWIKNTVPNRNFQEFL